MKFLLLSFVCLASLYSVSDAQATKTIAVSDIASNSFDTATWNNRIYFASDKERFSISLLNGEKEFSGVPDFSGGAVCVDCNRVFSRSVYPVDHFVIQDLKGNEICQVEGNFGQFVSFVNDGKDLLFERRDRTQPIGALATEQLLLTTVDTTSCKSVQKSFSSTGSAVSIESKTHLDQSKKKIHITSFLNDGTGSDLTDRNWEFDLVQKTSRLISETKSIFDGTRFVPIVQLDVQWSDVADKAVLLQYRNGLRSASPYNRRTGALTNNELESKYCLPLCKDLAIQDNSKDQTVDLLAISVASKQPIAGAEGVVSLYKLDKNLNTLKTYFKGQKFFMGSAYYEMDILDIHKPDGSLAKWHWIDDSNKMVVLIRGSKLGTGLSIIDVKKGKEVDHFSDLAELARWEICQPIKECFVEISGVPSVTQDQKMIFRLAVQNYKMGFTMMNFVLVVDLKTGAFKTFPGVLYENDVYSVIQGPQGKSILMAHKKPIYSDSDGALQLIPDFLNQ